MFFELLPYLLHLGFVIPIVAEKHVEVFGFYLALYSRLSGFTITLAISSTIHGCHQRGMRRCKSILVIEEQNMFMADGAGKRLRTALHQQLHSLLCHQPA